MQKKLLAISIICGLALAALAVLFWFAAETRAAVYGAPLSPDVDPVVTVVQPNSSLNDIDTPIVIQGAGFSATLSGTQVISAPMVYLGDEGLADVVWGSTTTLSATVPWGLVPDIYPLTVVNPDGISTTLPGAFTVTNGIGVWTTGGPYGGRANFIAQHPADHQILYVGAQWVGIFRSQDAGTTWEPILPTDWPNRLQFDAVDSDVIYVSGEGNPYITKDGGENWEVSDITIPADQGCSTSYIAVHPGQAGKLYAGIGGCPGIPLLPGGGGVFYSEDYGENWISRTNGLTDTHVLDLAFDPADANKMLLLTEHGNIFYTADGALNWNWKAKIEDNPFRIYYNPYTANQYWAITRDDYENDISFVHQMYTSTNMTEWSGIDLPLHAEIRNLTFEPGGIWAAAHFGFFSADQGINWTEVITQQPGSGGITDFLLDASDPNMIYAGGLERGFYKITDGGANWEVSNTGLAALTPSDVVASNLDPDTVFVNVGGFGLMRSFNGGTTWQELGVRRDGGPAAKLLALDPFVEQRVYYARNCVGPQPCLSYSSDAGNSWSEVQLPVPITYTGWTSQLILIQPHTLVSGTIFTSVTFSETAGIYRSDDYGESWQYIGPTEAISEAAGMAFDAVDPDLIYIGTNGTGLWRSTDGGKHWAHVPISNTLPPVSVPAIAAHPDISNKVYLRTYSHATTPNPEPELWVSEDAGDSWQPLAYVFLGVDLLVVPPLPDSPPYSLYTGCEPGLCRSIDDGQAWQSVAGSPRPEILAAASDGERVMIYLGSPGGLVTQAGEQAASTENANLDKAIIFGGGVYRLTRILPTDWLYLPTISR